MNTTDLSEVQRGERRIQNYWDRVTNFENLTQFNMKAIIVNVSVVVGLLFPVHFDSHARHKDVEDRVKKMLGYFVVQRGVGGIGKICFERSMYLFRERGVKIVVGELGSGVNSIRRNLKEARVVLAARAAKGIEFLSNLITMILFCCFVYDDRHTSPGGVTPGQHPACLHTPTAAEPCDIVIANVPRLP